ncbi:hypothetical protein BD560DRAFT_404168 [Blakeslea trispora]|nr:hypothetical protein BD560DRAFT_404168 [Blakeslea trispora]
MPNILLLFHVIKIEKQKSMHLLYMHYISWACVSVCFLLCRTELSQIQIALVITTFTIV